MSIALVVTSGYGNGALSGTIKGVVLRGYGVSDATPAYNFDVEGTIDASDTSTRGIITAIESVSGTIDDTPTSVIGLIE